MASGFLQPIQLSITYFLLIDGEVMRLIQEYLGQAGDGPGGPHKEQMSTEDFANLSR